MKANSRLARKGSRNTSSAVNLEGTETWSEAKMARTGRQFAGVVGREAKWNRTVKNNDSFKSKGLCSENES